MVIECAIVCFDKRQNCLQNIIYRGTVLPLGKELSEFLREDDEDFPIFAVPVLSTWSYKEIGEFVSNYANRTH